MAGKTGYDNRGLYNRYDKNNKERAALDYYSTPTNEVLNILNTLNIDFSNKSILEPCIGGGHMAEGINEYLINRSCSNVGLIGSDIQDRGYKNDNWQLGYGKDYDFFSDEYPNNKADWIIMNPPFSVIEPFMIRSLEIAEKGIIMLARLQILEGSGRYENILKNNPPTDVYVYVDRIQCWKNGIKPTGTSAQAYAWIVWDNEQKENGTQLHWIRRSEN